MIGGGEENGSMIRSTAAGLEGKFVNMDANLNVRPGLEKKL